MSSSTLPRTFRLLITAGALALLAALPLPSASAHEVTHSGDFEKVDHEEFAFGSDLAFQGNLVAAGSANWLGGEEGAGDSGVHLFRRRNDGTLDHLTFAPCSSWHADVDFVGSRYVVQSHDSAGDNLGCNPGAEKEGVRVLDISNRRFVRSVGFAETIHGSHNLTTYPGTGLVYVASYNLGNPFDVDGVSIVDVGADPVNPPVTFLEFPDGDATEEHPDLENTSGDSPNSMGCHDIKFDLDREEGPPLAFCAGITETQIWDVSDPRAPVIIEIIKNPLVNIHHGADANVAGDILILNDEWAGAAGGNTACLTGSQPTGALWFYDISDPTNAQLLSYWSPPSGDPSEDFCTSHFFGAFTDDAGNDLVVTSWYDHGVWVVDFSDPSAPVERSFYEPEGTTFWAAYPYKGRIYASSFAPATITASDEENAHQGGVWVLRLDGYGLERPGRTPR